MEFPFSLEALEACQFERWYPLFRRHTIKSRIVPLEDSVVAWLQSESMTFPDWLSAVTATSDDFAADVEARGEYDLQSSRILDEFEEMKREYRVIRPDMEFADNRPPTDSNSVSGEENDEADEEPMSPELERSLRALAQQIDTHIRELGGSRVFAKTNWRSPSDAVWVTVDNTLSSSNAAEVLLLLKSSDRIVEDLVDASERFRVAADEDDSNVAMPENQAAPDLGHIRHSIALRKWSHMGSTSEFRCFVRDGSLVAISQRSSVMCPVMSLDDEEGQARRDLVKLCIRDFWETEVADRFPLDSYCFDVFIDRSNRVFVIDFHPYGPGTASKLFDWGEAPLLPATGDLESGEEPETLFRVVDSHGPGRDYQPDAGSIIQRLPADGIDVSDAAGIERFAEMCETLQKQQLQDQENSSR